MKDFLVKEAILRKASWLQKAQKKIRAIEKLQTFFLPKVSFSTLFHKINIVESGSFFIKQKKETINIGVPQKNAGQYQSAIRTAIEKTMRHEAREYLPERTLELAGPHGFPVNKINVRNNRSRWGSCSARNNISLNIHLMRLPKEQIDYVLYHELCHTLVKNHSKKFWKTMDKVLPKARHYHHQLKKYSPVYW